MFITCLNTVTFKLCSQQDSVKAQFGAYRIKFALKTATILDGQALHVVALFDLADANNTLTLAPFRVMVIK